jgi:hypothetical protein
MNHATARGMGDGVCSPDYLAEFVRAQRKFSTRIFCKKSGIIIQVTKSRTGRRCTQKPAVKKE